MTTSTLPPPVALNRRLFTVDEVMRLDEIGFFGEDERIELIEGEILRMTPIGQRHNKAVSLLISLFARLVAEEKAVMGVQGPAQLSGASLPQPDFLLMDRAYLQGDTHPLPDHIRLLVEVSESTLRLDRTVKLPLYARAGIAECWIVNLQDNALEVYRDPDTESGTYRQTRSLAKGEKIAPVAFPDFEVPVSEVLP